MSQSTPKGVVTATVEELYADPHGVYSRLRREGPVLKCGEGFYALRGKDIQRLLEDRRVRHFEGHLMALRGYPPTGPMSDFNTYSVAMSNDETHVRRRRPLNAGMARPAIMRLKPMIQQEAERAAAALPRGVEFDFLEQFSSPMPGRIIATVAGLDPENWRTFASRVYEMTTAFAPPFPADRWESIEESAASMFEFVTEALEDRRHSPRSDFVSDYVKSTAAEPNLTEIEIRATMVAVLVGGSDTTRGGLTYLHGLLLNKRELWEAVCADESLIPGAINEMLRFEPPVASLGRMTAEEVDIQGVVVPAGVPLELVTMSGMRDPELYAHPHTFDIKRTDGPRFHLGFGGGVHRCAGEYLARLELEEGLKAVSRMHPNLRMVGPRVPPKGFQAVREAMPLIVQIPV